MAMVQMWDFFQIMAIMLVSSCCVEGADWQQPPIDWLGSLGQGLLAKACS